MKHLTLLLFLTIFATGTAFAQSCESKAVSKAGKLLYGAAKTSFLKKCKTDACANKAVRVDGQPLAGAAKASFLKKCRADA